MLKKLLEQGKHYGELLQGVSTMVEHVERCRRAVLVDVRQESEFEQGRAKGSVNIPLYQGIDVQNGFDLLRKAAFFFFGLSGTGEPAIS